jgi:hypothetical protein
MALRQIGRCALSCSLQPALGQRRVTVRHDGLALGPCFVTESIPGKPRRARNRSYLTACRSRSRSNSSIYRIGQLLQADSIRDTNNVCLDRDRARVSQQADAARPLMNPGRERVSIPVAGHLELQQWTEPAIRIRRQRGTLEKKSHGPSKTRACRVADIALYHQPIEMSIRKGKYGQRGDRCRRDSLSRRRMPNPVSDIARPGSHADVQASSANDQRRLLVGCYRITPGEPLAELFNVLVKANSRASKDTGSFSDQLNYDLR